VAAAWEPLYEAAHYCDRLVSSGLHPAAEGAGLGLHCWLKERGLLLSEVLAWGRDEVRARGEGDLQLLPSGSTRSEVFAHLTHALGVAIRRRVLPSDVWYLERLEAMAREARRAIRGVEGRVTVVAPAGYVDPLALYRVVETDLVVIVGELHGGATRYTLGVHPRAYSRLDLGPVLAALAAREPGWGGRTPAGHRWATGSRVPLEGVVAALNAAADRMEASA